MLAIEGAIVTIDAMGCQRDIAQKILDKKADYVLALKGNQGSLRGDVELFAAEQKARGFADTAISRDTTIGGDHGRIETRTTTVIHDVGWLQQRHSWPGLKAVVMVESSREISGKTAHETRFYLTSLVMVAALLAVSRERSRNKGPANRTGNLQAIERQVIKRHDGRTQARAAPTASRRRSAQ